MSAEFIIWMAVAKSPVTGRVSPVPSSASSNTPASRAQAAKLGSASEKGSRRIPSSAKRDSMARQSGVIRSRSPTRTARTSTPDRRSSLAAATPSPPLFPGPQNTTALGTLCRSKYSIALSARASAACSISSREEISPVSMACRSKSLIRAAVAMRMADISFPSTKVVTHIITLAETNRKPGKVVFTGLGKQDLLFFFQCDIKGFV